MIYIFDYIRIFFENIIIFKLYFFGIGMLFWLKVIELDIVLVM